MNCLLFYTYNEFNWSFFRIFDWMRNLLNYNIQLMQFFGNQIFITWRKNSTEIKKIVNRIDVNNIWYTQWIKCLWCFVLYLVFIVWMKNIVFLFTTKRSTYKQHNTTLSHFTTNSMYDNIEWNKQYKTVTS